jgi:hemoglobin-like flavoprotein
MENSTDTVRNSMGRCLFCGDFIGKFYAIFFESHPDIKPMFVNTDMAKQKDLLEHGITLAILYASGHVMGQQGLERIRKSHSKTNLDVKPELYPFWEKSLIQAVSELDPEFNDEIKQAWDEVMDKAINYITDGYNGSSA